MLTRGIQDVHIRPLKRERNERIQPCSITVIGITQSGSNTRALLGCNGDNAVRK
jgi:hypothetical protein